MEVQTDERISFIALEKQIKHSEEREKRNFKHQLIKQVLISQWNCGRVFDDLQNRKSILKLLGTLKVTIDVTQNTIIHRVLNVANLLMDESKVLMTVNAGVFGGAQGLVQLGIMTAEAKIWQGIASVIFRQKLYNHNDNVFIYEVMLWMFLTGKSPYAHNWEQHAITVEEPKHHTESVLRIFEELELEVKVYSRLRIMQVKTGQSGSR